MCENMVEQFVPSGYSYKTVLMKCGSTSIYGTPLYCEECEKTHEAKAPWEHEDSGEADSQPWDEFAREYGYDGY